MGRNAFKGSLTGGRAHLEARYVSSSCLRGCSPSEVTPVVEDEIVSLETEVLGVLS